MLHAWWIEKLGEEFFVIHQAEVDAEPRALLGPYPDEDAAWHALGWYVLMEGIRPRLRYERFPEWARPRSTSRVQFAWVAAVGVA